MGEKKVVDRRGFLRLVGVGIAGGALAACAPTETYSGCKVREEQRIDGKIGFTIWEKECQIRQGMVLQVPKYGSYGPYCSPGSQDARVSAPDIEEGQPRMGTIEELWKLRKTYTKEGGGETEREELWVRVGFGDKSLIGKKYVWYTAEELYYSDKDALLVSE